MKDIQWERMDGKRASDIVSITFSLNETAPNSLKIINVLGQEIKRIVLTSSDEVSLKTSEIPHGLNKFNSGKSIKLWSRRVLNPNAYNLFISR